MASKRDKHIKHIKDDIMARVNEIMQKRKEKTERVKTAVKRRTENARAKNPTRRKTPLRKTAWSF